MFNDIQPAPPDAILGLTEAFQNDNNPAKINLGVGVYKDESGQTPVLSAVKKAEERLLKKQQSKSYLPIAGSQAYAAGVQGLIFGDDHPLVTEERVKTAHTPGGTGGLRVGAEFLKTLYPESGLWVSDPTWANHKNIFTAAGFSIRDCPYYDPATQGLNWESYLNTLRQVPAGDIVLMHVCCHNPTGIDPTPEQWRVIADVAAESGWLPFFDFAYQGFGHSVEEDRMPLDCFAEKGLECVVAASCSKNFGLYNERCGSFSLVASSSDAASASFSHVKTIIRRMYSNPPRHGAAIVEEILADKDLTQEWRLELDSMRKRITAMRTALTEGLHDQGLERDFSFINEQNGMFSFSGLTSEQVKTLKEEYSIYIVGSGRINVAGINPSNVTALCEAIAHVLR